MKWKALYRLSRTKKMLLGLATLSSVIYWALFACFFLVVFFPSFVAGAFRTESESWDPSFLAILLFPILGLLTLLGWAVIAVFIVDLFKNDQVPRGRRINWTLVLILFGVFFTPVYWYHYVWRQVEEPRIEAGPVEKTANLAG